MTEYRTRKDAYVYPTGRRPYREPARLDFRDKAEMKAQLMAYTRGKWPAARRIDIDLHSQQIIADSRVVGSFKLYEPRERLAEQTGMSL